jgi:hypothetical protein
MLYCCQFVKVLIVLSKQTGNVGNWILVLSLVVEGYGL